MLPVEVSATVAAVAVAPLKVVVQTATAPGPNVDGVHEIPLRVEVVVRAAVPPLPVTLSGSPLSVDPMGLESPTATKLAVGARLRDTVATTPFAMRFVLIPVPRQATPVDEVTQFKVLAAAVSAGPAVTAKLETEAAG